MSRSGLVFVNAAVDSGSVYRFKFPRCIRLPITFFTRTGSLMSNGETMHGSRKGLILEPVAEQYPVKNVSANRTADEDFIVRFDRLNSGCHK